MADYAIRITDLSKQYRLGGSAPYHRFSELLMYWAGAPLRAFRRISSREHSARQADWIWALKDVSFDVSPGEVVGVVGRNGAGKSTLLKILSRITQPTAGEVRLRGRVGSLLEVGTGFHPELSGRENIFLNGSILGMSRREIRDKFDAIVAFSEIDRFLDTPVKRYSSGMYMRLAFAVAAHLEPEILLIDEVLAVGDVAFQKKCLGKIDEVAKGGRTVLFVSHNMGAVEELCDRAILLRSGRVEQDSRDVRSVITSYLFGAQQEGIESSWVREDDRLANDWFSPQRMSICDSQGRPLSMPVSNDAEMWLWVDGEVGDVDPALNIGYAMFDETGELLYWTNTTDGPESQWPLLERGPVTLRSRIPSRFLNEGKYRLELMASLHCRQWICEPGKTSPSITLQIQGGLSESPLWMFRRPGLLAPVLGWERAPRG